MIWGLLWAAGVVAFLVFFFRGRLRWLFVWVFGLVAVIASAFLQDALMERWDVGGVVEIASQVGWALLIFSVIVLVAALAAMIVYTIRYGQSDTLKGKVVTENRPLTGMSLGIPPPSGWSKRKMLGGKSEFITMESLIDGTATVGERMMAGGIVTAMISFFLIFVGVGLIAMKELLIFILFPIIPGIWLYRIVSNVGRDYQEAKKRVATRGRVEQATDSATKSRRPHQSSMRP
ncbi:MAG: hypothetical protein HY205_04710 [Nitrospirae bacterium]|nr:hypothetical protein [Nitrospirota bacterium]